MVEEAELKKGDIELVKTILKELREQTTLEEKVVFLEEIQKKIESKQLKEEIQKLIRIIQSKLMAATKNIEFLLETSRIPLTHNVDIPLIKEIESVTPLEDKVGFAKQMDGEDKGAKAYLAKKDYFDPFSKTENTVGVYTSKENKSNNMLFGEDKKEDSYRTAGFEKQKTDKEPESYIVKDREKDKKDEKRSKTWW